MVLIMDDLAVIGKVINSEVRRASLAGIGSSTDISNVHGEDIKALDARANTLCIEYLSGTGHFCTLASEEEEGVISLGSHADNACYCIAFDPLDGCSSIDINASMGTIFSVMKRLDGVDRADERHFLQLGTEQLCAGYILYGSSTVLVFSFGDGVHEFTLDDSIGEFVLSRERLTIPESWSMYSVNEGNTSVMHPDERAYLDHIKTRKGLGARYIGALVADIHRTLIKGGIFLYPAIDKRGTGTYEGKLRLNYELKPLAFLLREAGGLGSDGTRAILDVKPESLHQRSAFIAGNRDAVVEYQAFIAATKDH